MGQWLEIVAMQVAPILTPASDIVGAIYGDGTSKAASTRNLRLRWEIANGIVTAIDVSGFHTEDRRLLCWDRIGVRIVGCYRD
jgi:hypothetical protein